MKTSLLLVLLAAGCSDSGGLDPELGAAAPADFAVAIVGDQAPAFPPDDLGPLQCLKDIDCPGDQVCNDGYCVELPDLATLPSGCANDSECKGGRVCRGGACVAPELGDLGASEPDLEQPDLRILRDLQMPDLRVVQDLVVLPDLVNAKADCEKLQPELIVTAVDHSVCCIYTVPTWDGRNCIHNTPVCDGFKRPGCVCDPPAIVGGPPDNMNMNHCPAMPVPVDFGP